MIFYTYFIVVALFVNAKAAETDKMINCYYEANSFRRPGGGNYVPEYIHPFACTHLSYAYFGIDSNGLITDPNAQLDSKEDLIKRTLSLKWKNPKLKVYAVVGGPNEKSRDYADMAADYATRETFIDSVAAFLQNHGFDGVDLNWQYPGKDGDLEDKYSFVYLVKQFKTVFDPLELDFGITVSGSVSYTRQWYDIAEIVDHVDFINVMSYGYKNGSWTIHDSPLYGEDEMNAHAIISYWMENGAPASKLNMGISLVGHSFVFDNGQPGLNKLSHGPMLHGGRRTDKGNLWGYGDSCVYARYEVLSVIFDISAGGSYLTDAHTLWISIQTPQSLEMKIDYAIKQKLGGIMVWSLENDDFDGRCGEKSHLIRFASRKLDKRFSCVPGRCCLKSDDFLGFCYKEYTLDVNVVQNKFPIIYGEQKKMVNCFIDAWALSNIDRFATKQYPTLRDLCTHISYSFIGITESGVVDEESFRNHTGLDLLREKQPYTPIIAVIRDTNHNKKLYSSIASNYRSREKFIASVLQFVDNNDFFGVDLHWLYHNEDFGNTIQEKRQFVQLLRPLQEILHVHNKFLGISVYGSVKSAHLHYELSQVWKNVDFINVLAYNYTTKIDTAMDHNAPIFSIDNKNIKSTIEFWLRTVPSEKLNLGVALFGRNYTLTNDSSTNGYKRTGHVTYHSYNEICRVLPQYENELFYDSFAQASYINHKNKWWMSLEIAKSLAPKLDFVEQMKLGGIAIWSLENDNYQNDCGETMHLLTYISRKLDSWFLKIGKFSCEVLHANKARCYKEY
ncbi:putative chitinase 10 [Haematobia irritans]|uniref:putative chitinase 10 n=1 Tax=Haematobia irritans TaxID=7368 RepID=UPI003F4F75F4